VESFLAALVECRWDGSLYERVEDPKLRYQNQLWGLRELILALAVAGPVVLHVEDAHWIEPSTAEWLRLMTRAARNVPLMILLTSRYAENGTKPRIPMEPEAPVEELELDRLDEGLTGDMVRTVLGGAPDEGLVALLNERTGGNPFFVEQLALHMRESGHLTRAATDGRWGLLTTTEADEPRRLPETLETVLLARFDRLEASLRDGLKHAATLGVRFLHRVLEELLGRSREFAAEPARVIPHAEEHAMILREGVSSLGGEQAYLFRHALMQRAAYHLQPPGMREYLHGLAADVVEELFPDREDMLVVLAEHLGKAGRLEREVEVLEQAAAVAKRGYRNAEALGLYERLRERLTRRGLGESRRMVLALYALASVEWLVGEWAQALRVTEEALALADRLGDDRLTVDGRVAAAERLRNLGNPSQATEMAQSARDLAVRCGYALGVARAMGHLGRLAWGQGDYSRALEALREQLRLSREVGNEAEVAIATGTMGIVFWSQGDLPRALECHKDWQQRAEALGDRRGIGRAIGNQGLVYFDLGDYERALACYQEQIRQGGEVGDRESMVLAIGNSGNVHCERGEYAKALESFREWQRRAELLGDHLGASNAIGNQANICLHLGRYDQTLQLSQEFIDRARAVGDTCGAAHGRTQQGYARLLLGNSDTALECFRDALVQLEGSGDRKNMVYALTGMTKAYHRRGEYQQALACNRECLDLAQAMGARDRLAFSHSMQASVLLAMGRTGEAAAEAEMAMEIARTLTTRPALIEPLLIFAEVCARQGEIVEARGALSEVRQILQDIGLPHRLADVDRVAALLAEV
jgi:tetratricopeptide (TPR) repeat protein